MEERTEIKAIARMKSQFPGKDASLEGVDNISGATFSSNYYRAAIADAYTAYGMVAG